MAHVRPITLRIGDMPEVRVHLIDYDELVGLVREWRAARTAYDAELERLSTGTDRQVIVLDGPALDALDRRCDAIDALIAWLDAHPAPEEDPS